MLWLKGPLEEEIRRIHKKLYSEADLSVAKYITLTAVLSALVRRGLSAELLEHDVIREDKPMGTRELGTFSPPALVIVPGEDTSTPEQQEEARKFREWSESFKKPKTT